MQLSNDLLLRQRAILLCADIARFLQKTFPDDQFAVYRTFLDRSELETPSLGELVAHSLPEALQGDLIEYIKRCTTCPGQTRPEGRVYFSTVSTVGARITIPIKLQANGCVESIGFPVVYSPYPRGYVKSTSAPWQRSVSVDQRGPSRLAYISVDFDPHRSCVALLSLINDDLRIAHHKARDGAAGEVANGSGSSASQLFLGKALVADLSISDNEVFPVRERSREDEHSTTPAKTAVSGECVETSSFSARAFKPLTRSVTFSDPQVELNARVRIAFAESSKWTYSRNLTSAVVPDHGICAASGARSTMEDRVIALSDLEAACIAVGLQIPEKKLVQFYAIYDGHNGTGVAEMLVDVLHILVVLTVAYKQGDYATALSHAFELAEWFIYRKFARDCAGALAQAAEASSTAVVSDDSLAVGAVPSMALPLENLRETWPLTPPSKPPVGLSHRAPLTHAITRAISDEGSHGGSDARVTARVNLESSGATAAESLEDRRPPRGQGVQEPWASAALAAGWEEYPDADRLVGFLRQDVFGRFALTKDGDDQHGCGFLSVEDIDNFFDVRNYTPKEFTRTMSSTVEYTSGATACVAVVADATMYVANVGDGRLVLCRAGSMCPVTIDHRSSSSPREAARLSETGATVDAQGYLEGRLSVCRAFGDLRKSTGKKLTGLTHIPDVSVVELCPDDAYAVIACDGVWDYITPIEAYSHIHRALHARDSVSNASLRFGRPVKKLLELALVRQSADNVSAIFIMLNGMSPGSNDRIDSVPIFPLVSAAGDFSI